MNNTFNLQRFLLLFKKHTIEHGKTYLLATAVLTGIMFLVLWFTGFTNSGRLPKTAQISIFVGGLILTGTIFTSLIFSNLGNKKEAIPILTLPVSHLERFIVAWIYSFIIFQLVFIGVFYITDSIAIAINTPTPIQAGSVPPINVLDFDEHTIIGFFFYAGLHAYAFWGAIFFNKVHFVKSAFVLLAGFMVLILINKALSSFLITGVIIENAAPFSSLHYHDHDILYSFKASNSVASVGGFLVIIITLLFWVSAFFRLKEKEV